MVVAAVGGGEFVAGGGSVHRVRDEVVEASLRGGALKPGRDIGIAGGLRGGIGAWCALAAWTRARDFHRLKPHRPRSADSCVSSTERRAAGGRARGVKATISMPTVIPSMRSGGPRLRARVETERSRWMSRRKCETSMRWILLILHRARMRTPPSLV